MAIYKPNSLHLIAFVILGAAFAPFVGARQVYVAGDKANQQKVDAGEDVSVLSERNLGAAMFGVFGLGTVGLSVLFAREGHRQSMRDMERDRHDEDLRKEYFSNLREKVKA